MDARVPEFKDRLSDRAARDSARAPVLLVPYTWIGDFVRCHTVVRLINARWPERPVDLVASPLLAPLAAYMPGVRKAIIADFPHRRLAVREQLALARRLRGERYGTVLVMSRKWKAALAPYLADIPERVGYLGEARFLLLNDARLGERSLPRLIDRCAALALPKDTPLPDVLPPPQLVVPAADVAAWRVRRDLTGERRAVALAPGAVGPSKRWPVSRYAALAAALVRQGFAVWVLGGPAEAPLAAEIVAAAPAGVRDLTGPDLREAVLALCAAELAVSNDSGLMHVAASLGTPTIGIFGPTSAWHWAPLNPLAAVVEASTPPPCRPCHKPVCAYGHHRCMQDIPAVQVLAAVEAALAPARATV